MNHSTSIISFQVCQQDTFVTNIYIDLARAKSEAPDYAF